MGINDGKITNANDSEEENPLPTETANPNLSQSQNTLVGSSLLLDLDIDDPLDLLTNLRRNMILLQQEAFELHEAMLNLRQNIADLSSVYNSCVNAIADEDNDSDIIVIEPDLTVYDLCEDSSNLTDMDCEEEMIYKHVELEDTSAFSNPGPFIQCKICLNSAVNNSPIATICGHIFCYSCILTALTIKSKCPVCTRIITLMDLFKLIV